ALVRLVVADPDRSPSGKTLRSRGRARRFAGHHAEHLGVPINQHLEVVCSDSKVVRLWIYDSLVGRWTRLRSILSSTGGTEGTALGWVLTKPIGTCTPRLAVIASTGGQMGRFGSAGRRQRPA